MLELDRLDCLRVVKGGALLLDYGSFTPSSLVLDQQKGALSGPAQLHRLVRQCNGLATWHVVRDLHLDELPAWNIQCVDGSVPGLAGGGRFLADAESLESLSPKLLALDSHVSVHLFEIIVHPADGTTGQAVVELVE